MENNHEITKPMLSKGDRKATGPDAPSDWVNELLRFSTELTPLMFMVYKNYMVEGVKSYMSFLQMVYNC